MRFWSSVFSSPLPWHWIIHHLKACVCLYRLPTWKLIEVCVCVHAGVCACCDLTLRGLSGHQPGCSPATASLSLSLFFLLSLPLASFLWCCQLCVFEFARGPGRVSMDGGAWLPLRIRYLPRWHHTGSYQLYPGEDMAGASNSSSPSKENVDFRHRGPINQKYWQQRLLCWISV